MSEIRAYPAALSKAERTPDKLVHGHYCEIKGKHYIVPLSFVTIGIQEGWVRTPLAVAGRLGLLYVTGVYEIDIKTAAIKTGRKDIYGSKGKMQGGDRVTMHFEDCPLDPCPAERGQVVWDNDNSAWVLQCKKGRCAMSALRTFKIIKSKAH